MPIRDIQPPVITECDLCGRTLLVGEQALGYVDAGVHRSVCELCTGRAREAGWIREDGPVGWVAEAGEPHRPSLWQRLRPGRPHPPGPGPEAGPGFGSGPEAGPGFGSGPEGGPGFGSGPGAEPGAGTAPADGPQAPAGAEPEGLLSVSLVRPRPGGAEVSASSPGSGGPEGHGPRALWRWRPGRLPASETAEPTEAETPVAAAVAAFNASDHPRTLTGVARSLGRPNVAVQEAADRPGVVHVVVFWDLCWYRYDIDVAGKEVRVAGQGYHLTELSDAERQPNATSDASGQLVLLG